MNTTEAKRKAATAQTDKAISNAKTHTTGECDGGTSRISDARLGVELRVPGDSGDGTNQEQLFAAAWSACFIGAIKHVDAEVDLYSGDEGFFLRARLNISLPKLDREIGEALIHGARQTCPYPKVTHGDIEVELNLVDEH